MAKRLPEGTSLRHARSCPSRSGGRCRCAPTYQAQAWSPRDRKRLTRTFPTLAAARSWRYDALVGLRHGTLRAAGSVTVRQAADDWLAAAQAGLVRNPLGRSLQAVGVTGVRAVAPRPPPAGPRRRQAQ
jgi:integrase